MKRKIQFSPPDISELEIEEVVATLKSGWITTGPRTKKYENNIAKYLGVNRAVCLNSQTACAEMALRLMGIGTGDEVITSAYTYSASGSVVCHVGARLVLVDVQEDSFEMDYDKVEKAINEHTKAIIPVDLGGVPCNYEKLFEIVERKRHLFKPSNPLQVALGRVAIMADAAHSFGAKWQGKMIGSVADFSSFSFHAVKNLTTAEGGVLTWRPIPGFNDNTLHHVIDKGMVNSYISDTDLYNQLQLLSLHGQSKDALAKTTLGDWEYDIVSPAYKCNMTDIMAAIGLKQLERYPEMLIRREAIIKRYDEAFCPLGIQTLPHFRENYRSSGHLYITRIPGIGSKQRNEIITKLAEQGIAANVHYKPLPMMSGYKKMGFDIKDFPNSLKKFENEITLPLHTCLSDEDVEYVIKKYVEIVKEYLNFGGNYEEMDIFATRIAV